MLDNLFNSEDGDRHPIPQRNFWLVLAVQFMMLASVPAASIHTQLTGTTIFLQTAPVDPYDILRGYYQILGYDISDRNQLKKLPGGKLFEKYKPGVQEFFVTVTIPNPPTQTAATAIAVSTQQPINLPSNQLAIRGTFSGGSQLNYGIEKFYMPEAQQQSVNQDIDRNRRNLLVEVKVDSNGHSVPMKLWVGNKSYSF